MELGLHHPSASPARATILVVDDDLGIREALEAVLSSSGYDVALAANGQAALDLLLRGRSLPSLILLDLMMPVMDGWQFRSRQLQQERLREIPVVIISAGGNVQQKAENLGAAGWLRKPMMMPVLLREVKACLRESIVPRPR